MRERIEGLAIGFMMRNRIDGTRIDDRDVEACFAPVDPRVDAAFIVPLASQARERAIRAVCYRFAQWQRCAGEERGRTANRTQTAYDFERWRNDTRCNYCDRFASIVFSTGHQVCAEHDPRKPREGEDLRPGFYYVSAQRDDGARVLVRGPYSTHRAALDAVQDTMIEAAERDFRAFWYAWGTARSETDLGPGKLGAA